MAWDPNQIIWLILHGAMLIPLVVQWSIWSCVLPSGPTEGPLQLTGRCSPAFFARKNRKWRPRLKPWYWQHVSRGPQYWHSAEERYLPAEKMVSFQLLYCHWIVNSFSFMGKMAHIHYIYSLKGQGPHIRSSCPLNWQLGPTLAAADTSCMPHVGRSELWYALLVCVCVKSQSTDVNFCNFQIFWGCSEHNQEPAPCWADHRPGEWGVFVSPVQVFVQHCCPSHTVGTTDV